MMAAWQPDYSLAGMAWHGVAWHDALAAGHNMYNMYVCMYNIAWHGPV
jgi:hypothetical protein